VRRKSEKKNEKKNEKKMKKTTAFLYCLRSFAEAVITVTNNHLLICSRVRVRVLMGMPILSITDFAVLINEYFISVMVVCFVSVPCSIDWNYGCNLLAVIKKPWSEEERAAVHRWLDKFLCQKQLPRKAAIIRCIDNEPALLSRSWKNVKDFCRNIISRR
jgi:hypothetical protein